MNMDEKLNAFLFMFSLIVFLYAFFTIQYSKTIWGETIMSIPITVIICPLICVMCILKMVKAYTPVMDKQNKKEMIRRAKLVVMNKLYEGIEEYHQWKGKNNKP